MSEQLTVEITHGEQTATFQCSRALHETSYTATDLQLKATYTADKWAFTENI
jgi:hypothetical protein